MALLGIPGLGTGELVIILVIVLVLFGPKRLPQLGKSLGKTMKSLRDGIDGKDDDEDEPTVSAKADAPAKPKPAESSEDESAEE
jgi:sec-independent protein translocase protein TatA